MTDYAIPRPTSGDVLELILTDHRLFEDLIRECRRNDSDRSAARSALAELIVAHGEAEEEKVYPTLRTKRAIGAHEQEHGEEEHAEINEALVAFLEAKGTDTEKYDSALEELATVLNHHANEEEQTILNPAREEVSEQARTELGEVWLARRNELLDHGCASLEQVKAILHRAEKEGVIAAPEAREKADEIKDAAKEEATKVEEASKAAAAKD
ncbi:hemerythrin domain-containing protein [Knoellia sp. CPCC 206435]|uniref:hemerythrin domain-containing protein n=1 Tax=Knoellia terrae TaxID=3404797 RepID=UPI003B42D1EE